jgi:hypothetical protein
MKWGCYLLHRQARPPAPSAESSSQPFAAPSTNPTHKQAHLGQPSPPPYGRMTNNFVEGFFFVDNFFFFFLSLLFVDNCRLMKTRFVHRLQLVKPLQNCRP